MINRISSTRFYFRNRHFLSIDLFLFAFTPLWALALRIDTDLGLVLNRPGYQADLLLIILLFSVIKLTVFLWGGLYRHYWRYASIDELSSVAILTG
ncbi:MAG: polysaccharide biosynthesis protein, partial [Acaryochloridaceae cyanobacterium SU_2_1]|nr:polysaccharide biosynthesis protein [Acaryochloridaceae cyanobacterium SU_2_1]